MEDLGALFCQGEIYRSLVAGTPRLEGPSCDVVLQKFMIDDVDYGWDQLPDVFRPRNKCLDIA